MANGIRVRVSMQRVSHFTEKYDASPATTAPTRTCPCMWSPAREGSFSTPAARMTGVTSRSEKRAASRCESAGQAADHGDAGATDPGEQREGLKRPDDGGLAVMQGGN